eukprot:TRINITY_DN1031_c0_g3_i1.p1 TRINITY_DN1031_c0_g3~~TRINITY_DN1031_c0_g3_i1.p1  ORF type:complete len:219 (-),score=17.03 TRINITY_DN1031_c0_g3_i1:50-706(-)
MKEGNAKANIIWIDIKQRKAMAQENGRLNSFLDKERFISSDLGNHYNHRRPRTANPSKAQGSLNRTSVLHTRHSTSFAHKSTTPLPAKCTRYSTISLPDENLKQSLLVVRGNGFRRQKKCVKASRGKVDFKSLSRRRRTLTSLSAAKVRLEGCSQYPALLVSVLPTKNLMDSLGEENVDCLKLKSKCKRDNKFKHVSHNVTKDISSTDIDIPTKGRTQ